MDRRPLPGSSARCRYRAYGIELVCDFPLVVPTAASPATAATAITATIGSDAELEELWSGGARLHEADRGDGVHLVVEAGVGGDHLIRHGEDRFHLAAGLDRITCAPRAADEPAWQHALLDWVAYAAASLGGAQCLHAGAVATAAGVIAVAAPSGAGKTTLVRELVERGAGFFCDDVLTLERRRDQVVVGHPGPPFFLLGASGGETLVAAERPATEAAPVVAVALLDRRPDGPAEPRLGTVSFADLRAQAAGLPRRGADFEAELLGTLSALAAQATVVRLEAGASVPAARLAAALETVPRPEVVA